MAKIYILNHKGDTTITYAPGSVEEEAARIAFAKMVEAGMIMVAGEEIINEFDPTLDEIVAIPRIAGGA